MVHLNGFDENGQPPLNRRFLWANWPLAFCVGLEPGQQVLRKLVDDPTRARLGLMGAEDDELSLELDVFKAKIEQLAGSQPGKKAQSQEWHQFPLTIGLGLSHDPFRFLGSKHGRGVEDNGRPFDIRHRVADAPLLLHAVSEKLVQVPKPITLRDRFPGIIEYPVFDHLLANLVDGLVRKVAGKSQEIPFQANPVRFLFVAPLLAENEGLNSIRNGLSSPSWPSKGQISPGDFFEIDGRDLRPQQL